MSDEFIDNNSEKSDVGQYWEISKTKDSIYAYIIEKDLFVVHFFERNVRGDAYRLNDLKFRFSAA